MAIDAGFFCHGTRTCAGTCGFVDEAKFFVKAGDGGNGQASFRREKLCPGAVTAAMAARAGTSLVADRNLRSLIDAYRSHFRADNGSGGQGSDKHGRGGKDSVIRVPLGSVIKDVTAALCSPT